MKARKRRQEEDEDPDVFFDGPVSAARERFQRVVDLVLKYGKAATLNLNSSLLAALLHSVDPDLGPQISAELEAERGLRRNAKRGRRMASRENDATFLQRMGIRWE